MRLPKIIFALVLMVTTMAACRRGESDFVSPNIYSYKVNNTTYVGGIYDAQYSADRQELSCNFYNPDNVNYKVKLVISGPAIPVAGTYKIGYDSASGFNTSMYYSTGIGGYQAAYGTVTISGFDQSSQKASGTFNFKGGISSHDSVTVSQGTFTDVNYILQ